MITRSFGTVSGTSLRHEPDIEVVGEATDGSQALRLVESLKPDIVLMDVVMPGVNGIEATRLIKESYSSTAVVIFTAYDDEQFVLALLEAGAGGHLLKSASADEIAQCLRAVHAGDSVLHPSVTAKVLGRALGTQTPGVVAASGEHLTCRELEVLKLVALGRGNKEIASELWLSVSTVKSHLVSIFDKMRVASRTGAVLEALRRGWVNIEACEDATPESTALLERNAPNLQSTRPEAQENCPWLPPFTGTNWPRRWSVPQYRRSLIPALAKWPLLCRR